MSFRKPYFSCLPRRNFLGKLLGIVSSMYGMQVVGTQRGQAANQDSIDILNFLLMMEYLQHALHAKGIDQFGDDLNVPETDELFGQDVQALDLFIEMRDHEDKHAEDVRSLILDLGGEPVQECQYNLQFESAEDYKKTALQVENWGVQGYLGAMNHIDDPNAVQLVKRIHSVEARHASIIAPYVDRSPFPFGALDDPSPPGEVERKLQPLIEECPDNN